MDLKDRVDIVGALTHIAAALVAINQALPDDKLKFRETIASSVDEINNRMSRILKRIENDLEEFTNG